MRKHRIPEYSTNEPAGTHDRLFRSFENCAGLEPKTNARVQTLGGKLRQCHRFRTEADYRISQHFSLQRATQAVSEARQVEKIAQELLK